TPSRQKRARWGPGFAQDDKVWNGRMRPFLRHLWRCQASPGAGEWDRAGGIGGQTEDEVSGVGTYFCTSGGTSIAIDIQAQPDEATDAAEADLFGTQSGGIAGGDAGHFGEVVHGSEFHFKGAGQLAHGVELAGDTFASGNTGLGAAIENFFDGVESGVVDAFSEGKVEGVGGGSVVEFGP